MDTCLLLLLLLLFSSQAFRACFLFCFVVKFVRRVCNGAHWSLCLYHTVYYALGSYLPACITVGRVTLMFTARTQSWLWYPSFWCHFAIFSTLDGDNRDVLIGVTAMHICNDRASVAGTCMFCQVRPLPGCRIKKEKKRRKRSRRRRGGGGGGEEEEEEL